MLVVVEHVVEVVLQIAQVGVWANVIVNVSVFAIPVIQAVLASARQINVMHIALIVVVQLYVLMVVGPLVMDNAVHLAPL